MPEYIKKPAPKPEEVTEKVRTAVSEILRAVEKERETAVRRYSEKFDRWNPPSFRVSEEEIKRAQVEVDEELKSHIQFTQDQVRNFAKLQRDSLTDFERTTLPGVVLGQKFIPVGSVGSYSPGGHYPLIATAIMTIVTPKAAGVRRVVACAPPRNGKGIHPPQLHAMVTSGADEIFCVGGVQALAALVFGIEDLKPIDMLVGPGNAYVAEAKRQLFGRAGIDLLAGPTEIMIIADDSADPEVVAADLLGQAEHGPTSPAVLLTTSHKLAESVAHAVEVWLERWPTAEIASQAWWDFGTIMVCEGNDEMVIEADKFAPEHLEIQTRDPDWFLERLTNYGTLFLGTHSTVVYSDKAIGTNHVLPTGGAARYTGGLWVGKFLKMVTYQRVTGEGSHRVAPTASAISDAELMRGHAITARLRLDDKYFPSTAK